MRVAITGASGFLGHPIASRLLQRGHDVAIIVRPGTDRGRIAGLGTGTTLIEGSLDQVDAWAAPLAAFRPDTLIHAGWTGVAGAGRDDPAQLRNAVATGELAALAARLGVGRFIGIGSQAEYGVPDRRVDEAVAPRPTTLYGVAKLAAALASERICRAAGMQWVWLRVFSVYGPRDHPGALIPSVIDRVQRGESPALTACEQLWDFLYVADAAAAVAALVETPGADGVYNLGSGTAQPLLDSIVLLRDLIDPDLPLGIGALAYRPDQVMHLEADISRLTAQTGWHPYTSLRDGFRTTIEWHRARRS